jgi:hypothetical protein
MGPSSGHSSPELSRLAVRRPSVAISLARAKNFGCRLQQIPLALTPFRGHLVREDVHHGTYTSGVHP